MIGMGENIPTKLGKIQKQLIFDIDSEKKSKVFDAIVNFMEFRDFSLTDSIRPSFGVFKRKKGWIGLRKNKIKFRIKDLDKQVYVIIGSNMTSEGDREKFHDEMDALKQFVKNKFKLKTDKE